MTHINVLADFSFSFSVIAMIVVIKNLWQRSEITAGYFTVV